MRGGLLKRAIAVLALLSGLVIARESQAFCRASACDFGALGTRCTPEHEGDCGVPLVWKERCIGFSVQRDGSRYFSSEALAELVTRAFETWSSADCGGAHPRFFVQRQPDATCGSPEYNFDHNQNKGNANIVMFRDDDWPYPDLVDGLALTTLTYDIVTGEIYDADIEINTFAYEFSTSDSDVTFDLLSTLQHETGHFLGLAHSPEFDSPMYEIPGYGTTQRRVLTSDDVAAVCTVYPPEEPALDAECSPMPHDFSPECAATLPSGSEPAAREGCSATTAPTSGDATSALATALMSACALRRRRASARFRGDDRARLISA